MKTLKKAVVILILVLASATTYYLVNSEALATQDLDSGIDILELNNETDLYVLPLMNSKKIEKLKKGSKVSVRSKAGSWSYVEAEGINGWIINTNMTAIEHKEEKKEEVKEEVKEEKKEQKEEQKEEQKQETGVKEEKKEEVVENKNTTNPPAKVDTSNIKYPTSMYVNVTSVYIRAEASTSSEKVTSIGKNTPVRVTGEEGDWFKVEVLAGKGYIMKNFLSKDKS